MPASSEPWRTCSACLAWPTPAALAPARSSRWSDPALDLQDAIGAEAGHFGAPTVERGPAGVVAEEGGHRPLLLVGVGPVHPLGGVVSESHFVGHASKVRRPSCGSSPPKSCGLTCVLPSTFEQDGPESDPSCTKVG